MQRRFSNRIEVRALAGLLAVLTALPACTGGGAAKSSAQKTLERYRTAPAEPPVAKEPAVGPIFKGKLTGSLAVGPSGAAIYTVPIAIPPGVAGMAPNLSLVYNSQGGNGIAGQGWELTDLSMIHRCPRTRIQDGAARPVMLDSERVGDVDNADSVCLDGQRLFEDPIGSGRFRTERIDFSEITRTADDGFQVKTKSGEVRRYGASDESRVNVAFSQSKGAAVWMLDRAQDVWGNYFDVIYNDGAQDFVQRGILVTEIKYTGHLASGTSAPDVPTFATVKFGYETRDDLRTIRFNTLTLPKNQRLTSIATDRGTYRLAYMNPGFTGAATLPSRLQTIDYCAGEGPEKTCLEPLTFGWNLGTSTFWTSANAGYALPPQITVGEKLRGTQFVDLDGDGRSDLVLARSKATSDSTESLVAGSWRNSGHGWDLTHPLPTLPTPLAYQKLGASKADPLVTFADMDGDGLLDLVRGRTNVTCTDEHTCQACPMVGACKGRTHLASLAVWLNRFKGERQGWEYHAEFENLPPEPNFIVAPPAFADMDGDGRADLVATADGSSGSFGNGVSITVMLNKAEGWRSTTRTDVNIPSIDWSHQFHAQDVNRDGLPDIVRQSFHVYPDGHLRTADVVIINQGPVTNSSGAVTRLAFSAAVWRDAPAGGTVVDDEAHRPLIGDIDGDGFYDAVMYYPSGKVDEKQGEYAVGVAMGNGTVLGFGTGGDAYTSALETLSPKSIGSFPIQWPQDYGTALVDANGDGLVDLLRNHGQRLGVSPAPQGGGQLLLNTGTTWRDPYGVSKWQVGAPGTPAPAVPDEANVNDGSSFIDLNGDGLADMIQEGSPSRAWLNTFQPPVIQAFPHQLATDSHVDYTTITTEEAQQGASPTYRDTGTLGNGLTYLTTPLRVVKKVTEDTGAGSAASTYQYTNLRGSALGYGPQGFEAMSATDANGTVTTTRFAQAYPYTGLPVAVTRENQGPVTSTETTYCLYNVDSPHPEPCIEHPEAPAAYPPRQSLFPRPIRVLERSYLRSSSFPEPAPAYLQTSTASSFDAFGNPTSTSVSIRGLGETHTTTTKTIYGTPGSLEEKMGKATSLEVTTDGVTHTMRFEYDDASGVLALRKKIVGADAPTAQNTEAHTVYDYDRFGNVTATMTCGSHFDDCALGNTGPADLPFRTTTVSYDPTDLPAGEGRVSYGVGRFPVRTSNAKNQSEYAVYDPLLGTVVSRTGPNGIRTCYAYDPFGQMTSETARCGTAHELTTTIARFEPTTPGLAKMVTVARPSGASPVWTFTDAVGRTIDTMTLGFRDGIVESRTEYNSLGQVVRISKPFLSSDEPFWTATTYDPLGRPRTITQDLGPLGDEWTGAETGTSVATMTYQAANPATTAGSTILTERIVNGEIRRRYETKNAIGKVTAVTDADGQTITFAYDGDGNLTDTRDPAGNVVHLEYDRAGRKVLMRDPDQGEWRYVYNAFDELETQTDAKGQTTSMTYDVLGRMLSKTDATGTARWAYDVALGAGIGKLAAMVSAPNAKLAAPCRVPFLGDGGGGNRTGRSFSYTDLGDTATATECTDGDTFATSYDYDELGRQRAVTYPAVNGERLSIGYNYTKLGYLHFVTDQADGAVLWAADAINAAGQVTAEHTGNGVDTASKLNPATGWLLARTSAARADGDTQIQNWAYRFDEAGNLRRRLRADQVTGTNADETFTYDGLDRLVGVQATEPARYSESYAYDALGNITQKGGATYRYDGCLAGDRPAGPHAVCAVGGADFTYDANGGMTSGNGRIVSYNVANRPTHIEAQESAVDFVYGADSDRVVQSVAAGQGAARTLYVGLGGTGKSLYERTARGATVEHTQFIYAGGAHGGNAFAVRTVIDAGAPTTRYNHFDHLGSITAVSDEEGHVATGGRAPGLLGYDAWGARRASESQAADPGAFDPPVGHREYTGHETIPGVGLINMNGRVYDPTLGRFLSPDPNIQAATDLQNYNRYSYVLNNPLRYTDPTGYFFSGWFDFAVNLGLSMTAAAVCVGTGPGCAVGFMVAATIYNAASAAYAGASWDQIALNTAVGLATSWTGTNIGAAMGGSPAANFLGGLIASSVSTTMMTLASGGSWSDVGRNVLISAGSAAATAAATYTVQSQVAVTKASVAETQGRGGSGESLAEVRAREQAAGGAAQDASTFVGDRSGDTGIVLASAENGAEGHGGSASDAGPSYDGAEPSKRFTPDQEAAVDLAKDAKQRGGVSTKNADTLVKWGKEVGFGDLARGPENHGGASGDHIHIGPVNHIPVLSTGTLSAPSPAVVGGFLGAGVIGTLLYYGWPILLAL